MAPLDHRIAALGVGPLQGVGRDWSFDRNQAAMTPEHGQTVVIPLLHLSWLRARGAEAESFLQGQLSNDVTRVTPSQAQLSSYSNPKGRVLTLLTLLRPAADTLLLETQLSLAETTLKRLRLFVLRSRLVLDEALPDCDALGLAGPDAAAILARAGLPVPAGDWACAASEPVLVMRRPGSLPRFSLHGPPSALAALWPVLSQAAQPAGTAHWRLLDILAGVPSVHPETRELFVPQMLNLDAIDGVSFTKGCYPGQEIVARLHYLGTPKRRMVRSFLPAGDPPAPGTSIHALDGDGQAVGEVVDAAPYRDGQPALLLSLQTSRQDSDNLVLGAGDAGRRLSPPELLI